MKNQLIKMASLQKTYNHFFVFSASSNKFFMAVLLMVEEQIPKPETGSDYSR
jgi:hypothetical protein